jgi:hypothetical protein
VVLLLERGLVSWLSAIDERSEHKDLRGSDRRSVIPYSHGRMGLYCPCEPEPFMFLTPRKWRLPEPCIAQGQAVTTSPKARQVASEQVKPYAIGTHWPGVANDVFDGVGVPDLVACLTTLDQ